MEMVPHDKLMQAVKYYCKHGSLPNFWDYLGDHGSYHMQWNAWEMSIEAARKVDLLLSPYAEVLLKASSYTSTREGLSMEASKKTQYID